MRQRNLIILIGFMGTGKTTVGKALADRLKLPLTDTDQEIERKTGKRISELFREFGEEGFRDLESQVLKQVLDGTPGVVTTGGGVVLRPENVRLMKETGWVVALHASEEEILRRLAGTADRPLLLGDVRQRVSRLLNERRGLYDFAHVRVDTTGMTVAEVVDKICRLAENEAFKPDRSRPS
ncbi:shikimate kinase [Planifilum fimeticola]|jgi:shikimate kinase|uniref:Shikimate kinase n=1 Tax=Planifilum fimeticola TaxID=201975 RepID=A0A2T0LHJ8_9BACL|nr:shikimate kinase [Planifilum fimeticola]PRX41690.1 shikimate kinase [Planifilum fimeticola]